MPDDRKPALVIEYNKNFKPNSVNGSYFRKYWPELKKSLEKIVKLRTNQELVGLKVREDYVEFYIQETQVSKALPKPVVTKLDLPAQRLFK